MENGIRVCTMRFFLERSCQLKLAKRGASWGGGIARSPSSQVLEPLLDPCRISQDPANLPAGKFQVGSTPRTLCGLRLMKLMDGLEFDARDIPLAAHLLP